MYIQASLAELVKALDSSSSPRWGRGFESHRMQLLGSTSTKKIEALGGTRTRNPQIRSLMRYPLRH
jgi:hypothetical protein